MNANERKPTGLDELLPQEITAAAVRTPAGNEWVIPLPEVKQAIGLASANLIAVLGVESFRILEDGLGCQSYTGYAFDFQGDWPAYVRQNNEAALRFIEESQLGKGYGYILTTTSEDEFKSLEAKTP